MKIYSIPPISDNNARALILGTMPGEMSLKLNQYYGKTVLLIDIMKIIPHGDALNCISLLRKR